MVRFRLLCGDFLLPNPAPNLDNRMTVCMGYPAMIPKWESRKTPPRGGRKAMQGERRTHINWSKWPVDVVNDTKRHSPEELSALRLTSCGQNVHMRWIATAWINVDDLSTSIPFVLRLTSTWHFVKPRWNLVSVAFRYLPDYCNTITPWWVTKTVTHHLEVVNGQNIHLPPSHNAQILVGDHFDHQPDNRNALLCKRGCYRFDNRHASVTLLANNAFHYPPHTCSS